MRTPSRMPVEQKSPVQIPCMNKVTSNQKKPGDVITVTFEQELNLQGGEYLLSFGCTGYRDADFHVYHRLYDACSLTVVSTKNTVGFFDMNSKVTIEE